MGALRVQSLPFPIDFAGRPYNTLTLGLPCKRVIIKMAPTAQYSYEATLYITNDKIN